MLQNFLELRFDLLCREFGLNFDPCSQYFSQKDLLRKASFWKASLIKRQTYKMKNPSLTISPFLSFSLGYFSTRRGCPRVLKYAVLTHNKTNIGGGQDMGSPPPPSGGDFKKMKGNMPGIP